MLTSVEALSRPIILSIRPEWELAISEGRKTLEFRKRSPQAQHPYLCYLYVSGRTKAIASVVTVIRRHVGSPEQLAELASRMRTPESPNEIVAYFGNCHKGFALELRSYTRLLEPVPLNVLRELNFRPTMNYSYLDRYPLLAEHLAGAVAHSQSLKPDEALV